ncbi:MAG TPA: hypothetical protein VF133_19510 [Terriglobales bacterium]
MTVASVEEDSFTSSRAAKILGRSSVLVDVLGSSVLDRTVSTLKQFATVPPSMISEGASAGHFLPQQNTRSANFVAAWEESVARYVQNGVEMLLLLRVNAYHEVDYQQLLDFHLQTNSALTQVYAPDGSLEIALVKAAHLRTADSCLAGVSSLIAAQRRFPYSGYVNRLRSARDCYQLVSDGLHGACALTPAGSEVRERVWVGEGAEIDNSAAITAPAFVGAGSRVAACCAIADTTSIERNCEIDCGTTVSQSWVLPNTYIGMALTARRSVVSNKRLFHLDRNVAVSCEDPRLVGPRKGSSSLLTKIESFLRYEPQTAD